MLAVFHIKATSLAVRSVIMRSSSQAQLAPASDRVISVEDTATYKILHPTRLAAVLKSSSYIPVTELIPISR